MKRKELSCSFGWFVYHRDNWVGVRVTRNPKADDSDFEDGQVGESATDRFQRTRGFIPTDELSDEPDSVDVDANDPESICSAAEEAGEQDDYEADDSAEDDNEDEDENDVVRLNDPVYWAETEEYLSRRANWAEVEGYLFCRANKEPDDVATEVNDRYSAMAKAAEAEIAAIEKRQTEAAVRSESDSTDADYSDFGMFDEDWLYSGIEIQFLNLLDDFDLEIDRERVAQAWAEYHSHFRGRFGDEKRRRNYRKSGGTAWAFNPRLGEDLEVYKPPCPGTHGRTPKTIRTRQKSETGKMKVVSSISEIELQAFRRVSPKRFWLDDACVESAVTTTVTNAFVEDVDFDSKTGKVTIDDRPLLGLVELELATTGAVELYGDSTDALRAVVEFDLADLLAA